jgi:endonuclease/exonuclease/phosphatase family metal-dependent hydrolase
MIFRFVLLLMFVCIVVPSLFSQDANLPSAKILFYNVENLFNPEENEGKNDEAFYPDGVRRWTHYRKQHKQNNIARVILYAGQWDPPVLVGLCEIEDQDVLDEMIWHTGLHHLNYSVIHYESPDRRGIDVALLYRDKRFSVLKSKPVSVLLGDNKRPTRDILYVKGVLDDIDTLHVMVNHWPSRWGGEGTTRFKRVVAANVLKQLCDSLLQASPRAKIIAMGDFNDDPTDESMLIVGKHECGDDGLLTNMAHYIRGEIPGTIRYRHQWYCFDQILVSDSLCTLSPGDGFLMKDSVMHIVAPDFLLEKDPKYPGYRPKRTFLGYKYLGGFSDHLPVFIELQSNCK